MNTAAAYRHIRPMRTSSGRRTYRRNAVNAGFLDTSGGENYRNVGIKDSVLLDPAAGSGNFLTETYLCLRALEFAVISEQKRGKNIEMFESGIEEEREERVKLSQFYGIEINDFAVSVAETALWISRLKANAEAVIVYDLSEKDFPLEEAATIVHANALRIDWNDVLPASECSYIMGNPPFVGSALRSEEQTEDMGVIAFNGEKTWGKVDYCGAWYYMAAKYINNYPTKAAFVSTNSLCQGEQVQPMWKSLFDMGFHIEFAWKTFIWNSEATDQAHVHCVIVGFSKQSVEKRLYYDDEIVTVKNINGYLVDAPNVFLPSRGKPVDKQHSGMIQGSKPVDDGGLVLDELQRDQFVSEYPSLVHIVHLYLGADEFIKGKRRYCFWFKDEPESVWANNPVIQERLQRVAKKRASSPTKEFREFADRPHLFVQDRQPSSDYLIVPQVSSERRDYVPVGYLSADVIVSNAAYLIPHADLYEFGIVTSNMHNAWMRIVAGRLKSDYRYSPVVYNTFAYPDSTSEQKAAIEQTAQGILDARDNHPGKSLADLYDPDKMPADLKAAHEANDMAVMDAYGFPRDMTEPEIVAELMKMYQKLTENT